MAKQSHSGDLSLTAAGIVDSTPRIGLPARESCCATMGTVHVGGVGATDLGFRTIWRRLRRRPEG
jgi:hypothetical protein